MLILLTDFINIQIIKDFGGYVYENVACLLYFVDVWPYEAVHFAAFASLVGEAAEIYGSWLTLTVLSIGFMTLLSVVLDFLNEGLVNTLAYFNMSSSYLEVPSTNKLVTDITFYERLKTACFTKK